uniref:Uncharacterized protein n=1 Tax=Anguilla anguilla TaxID=7936 RepID=A0A0E9WUP4_ANGAN
MSSFPFNIVTSIQRDNGHFTSKYVVVAMLTAKKKTKIRSNWVSLGFTDTSVLYSFTPEALLLLIL